MTGRQADPKPLSALLDDHPDIDEAFLRHQDALLMRNAAGASARLERFASLLLPHLEMEEELLLPIYAARARPIVGAAPLVFQAEHRKIRDDLAALRARTAELESCGEGNLVRLRRDRCSPSGGRGDRFAISCKATLRQFLALLDREYLFKDYLKHHDLRERNAFYPELDRVTTPEERAGLWARIAQLKKLTP